MLNNSVPSGVTTGSHGGEDCRSGISISPLSTFFQHILQILSRRCGSKQETQAHGYTSHFRIYLSSKTAWMAAPQCPLVTCQNPMLRNLYLETVTWIGAAPMSKNNTRLKGSF